MMLAAMAAVAISAGALGLAYGQGFEELPLTVGTDKERYGEDEIVTIRGSVGTIYDSGAVSIRVTSPSGNVVVIDQIPINFERYEYTFVTGGTMKEAGTYTVEASYYVGIRAAATFEYEPPTRQLPGIGATEQPLELGVDGTDITIPYEISDGFVRGVVPLPPDTLQIFISSDDAGYLELDLPREIFDSVDPDGGDKIIIGVVDGNFAEVNELSSDADSRSILVEFPADASVIELRGTHVVPEFLAPLLSLALAGGAGLAAAARPGLFHIGRMQGKV